MRKYWWALAVVIAAAGGTRAGEPELLTPPPDPGLAVPELAALAPAADPPVAAGPPPVAAELLIGFPVAVRLEAVLAREGRAAFSVEGVAGVYIIAPFAGAGGRVLWTALRSPQDSLLLAPGVEFDYAGRIFHNEPEALVTPDVEVLWIHEYSPGVAGTVGADLGAGVAVSGGRPSVVPRVSFSLGIRF